ncbi:MAG: hypothetical protein C5B53_10195 [Candidatus Melainabacteria bacterium]|nr:MAG: hypothetical protein C5B53_10195 [Candidatus Melainabacteria bacterium]
MKVPDGYSYYTLFDALRQRVLSCDVACDVEYCLDLMDILVAKQEDLLIEFLQNDFRLKADGNGKKTQRNCRKREK